MEIIAFKGYRYDRDIVGDAGRCIAPPYDVIDPDQQRRLCARSDYNIVRVIKPSAEDPCQINNMYAQAAETLHGFINSGAVKQDEQEKIYVYCQSFSLGDKNYQRSGFIALGRIEAYGVAVKPHEQTLSGPKTDRLNLMRATASQIGQIFMLYSDPQKKIDAILDEACRGNELLYCKDEGAVEHRLFAVTEAEQIAAIISVMQDKEVFIADGHHRYETALNYYNETGNPAAAYRMMTFVNMYNEGLIVLPTHRLIKNLADFDSSKLLDRMRGHFDVTRLSFADATEKADRQQMMLDALRLELEQGNCAFGMYYADGAFYVATLRETTAMDEAAGDKSAAWRQLDVAILHKLILERLLAIDEAALAAQSNVAYIKDIGGAAEVAIEQVDAGAAQGLFFMNPIPAGAIELVAAAAEKMPQKSTFFYPKIFSGLVLNVLS